MEQKVCFILGDKLSTYYDAAIAIYSVTQSIKSDKMHDCITSYAAALQRIWTKAFGEDHVISRSNIRTKIEEVVAHYNTHVYIEKSRTKPKKKNAPFVKKTARQLNKEWRQKSILIMKDRKRMQLHINALFDIGKNMDSLTGIEKEFYLDQNGPRIGRISESIDLEYEEEKAMQIEEAIGILAKEKAEEEYANGGDGITDALNVSDCQLDVSDCQLDVSLNRSGHARNTISKADKCVQFDSGRPRPKIRNNRNCTFKSKSACARVSVRCNLSSEMSREAVKITCESMYDDEYYLSKEEAIEKDPSLEAERKKLVLPKPSKRVKTKETVPHTSDEWKVYENVLPSAKTINNTKQVLAIQHEQDAATALYNKLSETKVTLHFDATSRSKIDGDWPALILIFSNKRRFPLRPLFFAYEDRVQIIRLIVETYERLAATISTEQNAVSAKMLWEKTTAVMTDSVSKNLKIGGGVAECLSASHVPYHLLCKAHPVEGFDRSNLAVLGSIEKDVEFRQKLEMMNPAVKSFLRGKTSVVEAAMSSILSLVSHDKSSHSTNQAYLFDFILQRENQVNHIAMYYERRFTKLGYSAGSIIQALPYLRMLLNESHLSNQHIDIVRMFLDSEFLITELQVIAYFTHLITLPFLYFVEVNTIEELLEMFPRLLEDLKVGGIETLKEYRVEYPHVKVTTPTSDVAQKLFLKMSEDAATVLVRQAGREYGFGEGVDIAPRATQLHLLSSEERAGLPTHNLDAERHLAVFGKRAPVAKFRNKKFTAKGIRNDCTLFQSETFKNEQSKGFIAIVKLLNNMEKDWVDKQKGFHEQKILEKIEKGKNQAKYTQKCLQLCKEKEWKGPATSVEEIHEILKNNPTMKERVVRIELSYYRDTHKADVIQTPELFKINNIFYEEQLLNMCALLADDNPGRKYVTLPSNNDVSLALLSTSSASGILQPVDKETDIQIGHYYITLFVEGSVNTWYIASCEGKNDGGTYNMHHLARCQKGSNLKWKQPSRIDKDDLWPASIVDCIIEGEWDVSQERNMTFTLRNHVYISNLVQKITDDL